MSSNKTNISDAKFLSYLKSLGLLFPETEKELDRFNELYSGHPYELTGKEISPQKIIDEVKKEETKIVSKQKITKNKDYFKRIVLAAEITSQLYQEPTFGHIKLQKMIYLCEHYTDLHLPERYAKQAAGPYDRKFMHSIDYNFKRLKWFSVTKKKNSYKYSYDTLERTNDYKKYYDRYFLNDDKNIQWLIEIFRTKRSAFVELIATIHACIEEIIRDDENLSENFLIQKFYAWSEEKKRFKKEEISNALDWMYEKGIINVKLN